MSERNARPKGHGPITRDQVRELLGARGSKSTLVLLEGHARVVAAEELGSERYAGAVDVISGEELARTVGPGVPSEQDLDALAATLNTLVSKLGA